MGRVLSVDNGDQATLPDGAVLLRSGRAPRQAVTGGVQHQPDSPGQRHACRLIFQTCDTSLGNWSLLLQAAMNWSFKLRGWFH